MADMTTNQTDIQIQIDAVMALLGRVSEKFEPESGETWQWMADHAPSPEIAELLTRDMTFTMLRLMEAIAQLEPANGISISRMSGIPKGTVSKTARKLVAGGLITQESLPDNRKEVLFRLTGSGRALVEVHRAFDAKMERGIQRFLGRYRPDELAFLTRLLEDLIEVRFLEEK